MRRLLTVLAAVSLMHACDGRDTAPAPSAVDPAAPPAGAAAEESALLLTPRLQLVGLGDVTDDLSVSKLAFDAELVVLADDPGARAAGDSLDLRFEFDRGQARTKLAADHLRLGRAGRYSLFIRVRPGEGDDAASVTVGGAIAGASVPVPDEARHKSEEPAPIPAQPGGDEPAPIPADNPSDEPAPIPADNPADEPAPLPADQNDEEPAPIPADDPSDEPAPIPAREKSDDGMGIGKPQNEPVYVRSRQAYNFYAGTVDVQRGDTELLVTWDVRTWLRSVLADQLGIGDGAQTDYTQTPQQPGFADVPDDFRIDAR